MLTLLPHRAPNQAVEPAFAAWARDHAINWLPSLAWSPEIGHVAAG